MLFLFPPLIQQTPPRNPPPGRHITFQEAVARALDAYDLDMPLEAELPLPPKERAAYRWLRACASTPEGRLPGNPFSAGSAAHKEAEALRAFLALPKTEALRRLPTLPMRELGTHLALWRWGKAHSRRGAFLRSERRAFEDRLLSAPGTSPALGYALRHALCFALAEKDETRLTELRTRVPEGQESFYMGFQAAFGLLGGPLPALRLWQLPGRQMKDVQLGKDGSPVWIAPVLGPALPSLPPGTQWVIPSAGGGQDAVEARLQGPAEAEAITLEGRLTGMNRQALFAASRGPFERLGLLYFPLLMRFDGKGNLTDILMGDAAPAEPGDTPSALSN